MAGQFRFWEPVPTRDIGYCLLPLERSFVVPNLATNEGEIEFLKMMFQASVSVIPAGGNWYIGLCNQTPAKSDTLADITTEPGSAGGYARQALLRSAVGWPTLTVINGRNAIRSAQIVFTATGAAFDKDISRAFLTSAASGSVGTLFAYSGALSVPITLPSGQSFPMVYEYLLG